METEYKNVIFDVSKTESEILSLGANSIIKGQVWIASDTKQWIWRKKDGTFHYPTARIADDVPTDGKYYVRRDGAWFDITSVVNDSHNHSNKSILDLVEEAYTTAEKNKLAGIEAGAQVNEVTQAELDNKQDRSPVDGTSYLLKDGGLVSFDPDGEKGFIDFNPALESLPSYQLGRVFWNPNEKTIQAYSDNPYFFSIMGEHSVARGKNQTGIAIPQGTPVYFKDTADDGQGLQIFPATGSSYNENWAVFVTIADIPHDSYGTTSNWGTHVNFNTVGLELNKPAYLGENGGITSVRPVGTKNPIILGTPVTIGVNGIFIIYVEQEHFQQEFNGCFPEQHDYQVSSDGTNIYLDLEKEGGGDLAVRLGSYDHVIDCTTNPSSPSGKYRINLIEGTDTVPAVNFIYVELDGNGDPIMQTTQDYPSNPFSIVGRVTVWSASRTQIDGVVCDRRTTSAIAHNGRGAHSYDVEREGVNAPVWGRKGCTSIATIDTAPTPDLFDLTVASGVAYQRHRYSTPELQVSVDGIWVVNATGTLGLTNYTKVTNLIDLCGYTSGDVARNTNCRGTINVFMGVSKETFECKLFALLPEQLYGSSDSNAWYDPDGHSTTIVPDELFYVSILIASIPYDLSSGGNSVSFSNPAGESEIKSLLGVPIGVAGGGSSASTFIPNISQVLGQGVDANEQSIQNLGESEINATPEVAGFRYFSIFKLVDSVKQYLVSFRDGSFNIATALIANLGGSVAEFVQQFVSNGKSYFGQTTTAGLVDRNATVMIDIPTATGFSFNSLPLVDPANGDYEDNGTTQEGATVWKKVGEEWYIFKMDVNTQKHWAVHTSVVNGAVNWNLVTYRQDTAGQTIDSVVYAGLAVNGALNAEGSVTAINSDDDALSVAGGAKTTLTPAQVRAEGDSQFATNGAVGLWEVVEGDTFFTPASGVTYVSSEVVYNKSLKILKGTLRITVSGALDNTIGTISSSYLPQVITFDTLIDVASGDNKGTFVSGVTGVIERYPTATIIPDGQHRYKFNYVIQ